MLLLAPVPSAARYLCSGPNWYTDSNNNNNTNHRTGSKGRSPIGPDLLSGTLQLARLKIIAHRCAN